MLIGILSDTHDREPAMARAMQVLRDAGTEFFIHCGDIGGERVIDHLVGLKSAFVWGNTDWDRAALQRYSEKLGVTCYGAFGTLELDGKRIALLHGDDVKLKERLLSAQEHDYLLQGHTHMREDRMVGKTRIINPGALHRASEKTVAFLNTASGEVRFLRVE
jgi:uncharacterized protein